MAAPIPRVPPVTNATRGMSPSQMPLERTDHAGPTTNNRLQSSFIRPLSSVVRSLSFDAHCDAHAAADAQRGQALLRVALLHLVEQRHQHPRAGCPDRMADSDGAAIDIDLAGVPAEILVYGASLRGECFVGFDEIEVADVPAGLFQRGARS